MITKPVETIFEYYRNKRGFPYYEKETYNASVEFHKLLKYDCYWLLKEKRISQTMHGLGYLWTYFPHSFEVNCNGLLSPYEVFHDDTKLKKAIEKVKKFANIMSDSSLRKRLRTFSGAQGVSNFRPTAAKCIYEHFSGDGKVWDMSGGYGGRLFGASTSQSVKEYTCTEPATLTYNGLSQLKADITDFHDKKINVIQSGSEDYLPEQGSLDLCFTSPPYFDCEKYAMEDTQSFMKFPSNDAWMNGFFRQTIDNCYHGLKDDGVLIINIANVKSYKNICEDINAIIKDVGFIYHDTVQYALSNINAEGFKYEPAYVYRKGKHIKETAYQKNMKDLDALFE